MLKFRKKKLVQHVVRVEDLRIGDSLQWGTYIRPVVEIRELNKNERQFHNQSEYVVTMENVPPASTFAKTVAVVLFGDLKTFVWK